MSNPKKDLFDFPKAGPNQLAIKFFVAFSKFEYALKAAGFHNGDGAAEANWDKFAKDIKGKLQNTNPNHVQDAINYILLNPPKKQVVKNGLLDWDTSKPNTFYEDELLIFIRRVRNNLFHDGKFNGHWFAPERSEDLIKYSLLIFEECLKHSDKVREAFKSSTL